VSFARLETSGFAIHFPMGPSTLGARARCGSQVRSAGKIVGCGVLNPVCVAGDGAPRRDPPPNWLQRKTMLPTQNDSAVPTNDTDP